MTKFLRLFRLLRFITPFGPPAAPRSRAGFTSFLGSRMALLPVPLLVRLIGSALIWISCLGLPSALAAPPADGQDQIVSQSNLPAAVTLPVATLRNIDYMPRLHTLQPPARPHKILRWHHEQVQLAQDQKILRLLLVSVGIAGMFIAILVMRSMPPGKKGSGAA